MGIRQALNVPKSNKYVNEQIRGTRADVESKCINMKQGVHEGVKRKLHSKPSMLQYHLSFRCLSIKSFTFLNNDIETA